MNTRLNRLQDVSHAAIEVVAHEAQDIAAISADYQRAKGHRRASLLATITQKVDDLLFTMLDAFEGTVGPDEAKSLLSEHHPLTEARLAKLPSNVVPFVVLRELISVHLVPIDRRQLSNWHPFAERYRGAIA